MKKITLLLIAVASVLLSACGPYTPPSPEEQAQRAAWDAANDKIRIHKDAVAFGDDTLSLALAKGYSKAITNAEREFFTGGGTHVIQMSDGKFLTYCKYNKGVTTDSVLFIVHVPALKEYQGDVRDALMDVSFYTATALLQGVGVGDSTYVCIGLRSSISYKCVVEGKVGAAEAFYKKQNRISVSTKKFKKFFKVKKEALKVEKTPSDSLATDSVRDSIQ